ncbi:MULTISPECIES: methionyl-tRNA formyltransferase [Pediococcus]|jgi:methionyl-tRNA formyltransferase|uniref:Methionyl-tRNA formyltransferase n=1 Tax=Pediococcus parvulus TaxID=54062 RepID=A0A176TJF1_9LACO|nr:MULTISPECIES: methionyl-tRNA formyltransferase [Pediococcus]MCT3026343.1 methionyl-tRNA formyltransferase [Pediococcus parvulus]MCT3028427.1 methionyl-tRNA formyltransferase [Pediococcus parvulus]MDN5574785.1 methionyl-tRNA formyltransferase [Pediococcus sp.]MDV7693318.1 methionyl-tRNA formyltransferase [Pediococcus parvulus]OAD63662.1 methionyl-tRNA formyltransferase [Pediococcus parvulus]
MKSIIFMGTPQFAVPILQSLIQNPDYNVEAVVTQPDRRTGRKHNLTMSPVKKVAVENEIAVFQPEKISGSEEMAQLIALHADLIVTAAFGQFLPMKLINSVKLAAVNVHGSLLPKYRGGAPVQYAIMNGESETGITIIYMVKKMDAGKMLAQRKIKIEATDDVGSMFEKLSILGRNLLNETLPKLIAGELAGVEQDEEKVTFAPNIKPEEEQVDFRQSAKLVDAKVRALRPFPVSFVILNGLRTKLWQVTPLDQTTDLLPGQVVEKTKHKLLIATGKNGVVRLDRVQPAGKPQMDITDYLNGSQEAFYEGEQVIKL